MKKGYVEGKEIKSIRKENQKIVILNKK